MDGDKVKTFDDLVDVFAGLMKKRFAKNAAKGPLEDFAETCIRGPGLTTHYLHGELKREVLQLTQRLTSPGFDSLRYMPEEQDETNHNCADIANFALLISFCGEVMPGDEKSKTLSGQVKEKL